MRILFLFILTFFVAKTSAQEIIGKIESTNGTPIIGAYLYNPSTTIHSHSDLFGNFVIKGLGIGDTLNVKYLGYKNLEKVITKAIIDNPTVFVMEEGNIVLEQVSVSGGMRNTYELASIDLLKNPVKSSQEILQKVPGLIIAQHAGGGKAEQIFLRGFDIDHGTDIAITVDGMPVNMVSHAHGQGYSDLHFLIPETVKNIEFRKGPYYGDVGNFGTAGFVNFSTKDKLEESVIGFESGRFNTQRVHAMLDLLSSTENANAYFASEYIFSDGPFESSQNFNRLNIMGKFSNTFQDDSKLSIQASHFDSKWDASGQIPQRLVDSGEITRFGAVDDTEGGFTSRTNLAMNYLKHIDENNFIKTNAYFIKYDFQLFSNFTFFLDNPIDGDQIMQQESRNIYGVESKFFNTKSFKDFSLFSQIGVGVRHDNVKDNQLSSTLRRSTIRERFAFGDVFETDMFAHASTEFDFGSLLIIPSVRVDYFSFQYVDHLLTNYVNQSKNATIVSPKLNFIYNPNSELQVYLKTGKGYHANDSRVAVKDDLKTIPAAYGADLGTEWKPSNNVWINAALWYLFLEQEFVYVGDAAIIDPSGETSRKGVELGVRVQLTDNLFFDTDGTYTIARSIEDGVSEGENYIPLAPDLTIAGGLSYNNNNFFSSIRYQYIKDRPANEDNSLVAEGYLVANANASYKFKHITLGLSVDNLFNTEWNQAQFATESRLLNEPQSVEEIHFTPGTPFFMKGSIAFRF